jgi:hypothetical protein
MKVAVAVAQALLELRVLMEPHKVMAEMA